MPGRQERPHLCPLTSRWTQEEVSAGVGVLGLCVDAPPRGLLLFCPVPSVRLHDPAEALSLFMASAWALWSPLPNGLVQPLGSFPLYNQAHGVADGRRLNFIPQTQGKHPRGRPSDQVYTLVHRTLGEQGLPDMTLAPLGPPELRVGSPVLEAYFKSLRKEALQKTLSSQLPWLFTC